LANGVIFGQSTSLMGVRGARIDGFDFTFGFVSVVLLNASGFAVQGFQLLCPRVPGRVLLSPAFSGFGSL